MDEKREQVGYGPRSIWGFPGCLFFTHVASLPPTTLHTEASLCQISMPGCKSQRTHLLPPLSALFLFSPAWQFLPRSIFPWREDPPTRWQVKSESELSHSFLRSTSPSTSQPLLCHHCNSCPCVFSCYYCLSLQSTSIASCLAISFTFLFSSRTLPPLGLTSLSLIS